MVVSGRNFVSAISSAEAGKSSGPVSEPTSCRTMWSRCGSELRTCKGHSSSRVRSSRVRSRSCGSSRSGRHRWRLRRRKELEVEKEKKQKQKEKVGERQEMEEVEKE